MVPGLGAFLHYPYLPASVHGGRDQHLLEIVLRDRLRAGAGHQYAAGTQHLQRPQVDFLIPAHGLGKGSFVAGERRRIEHDGVVLAAGGGVILEHVEDIAFQPFDLPHLLLGLVQDGILLGGLQRLAGGINAGDLGANPREVQGEPSVVAKAIEGLAVGVARGGGVVFALVEECAGILSAEGIEIKSDAVAMEDGAGAIAVHDG